jgi:hypothetical protein
MAFRESSVTGTFERMPELESGGRFAEGISSCGERGRNIIL